jgi:hypothetical protein
MSVERPKKILKPPPLTDSTTTNIINIDLEAKITELINKKKAAMRI